MSISIKNVLKQSAKFNVVSVISLLLQIPNQVIIGIFLVPEEYGVVSFVWLWRLYCGLLNPGMLSASNREIPYLIGKNDNQRSVRVQNISISSDFLYSIVPFVVMLCASFFYANQLIKIGLFITAFVFLFERIVIYWATMNFIRQNFTVVAVGKAIGAILSPVVIIVSIYWLGIYAIFAAPLICSVFMAAYYFRKGAIGYRFEFEWSEIVRLVKVGFVFSLSAIICYGYRMTDRTIIASFLSLHELGLFAFAMVFIMFGLNFLADFGRVLEPILWEQTGKVDDFRKTFSNTRRIAIYMALGISIIIPIIQVGYSIVIALLVPKYFDSIPLFIILSSMLYLVSMTTIPTIILNSLVVNKQLFVTGVYAVGVVVNVVLDLLMIYLGYGIKAISLVTVLSQLMVVSTVYFFARTYMFDENNKPFSFVMSILPPFFVSILFSIFHIYSHVSGFGLWAGSFISLIGQMIVWAFVITVFYRPYFPREKVVGLIKEFYEIVTTGIKKRFKHQTQLSES